MKVLLVGFRLMTTGILYRNEDICMDYEAIRESFIEEYQRLPTQHELVEYAFKLNRISFKQKQELLIEIEQGTPH